MNVRQQLPQDRLALLDRYLDLLYTSGRQLNLTRVPREQATERHLDESLSLLPLRRWGSSDVAVDLGSGGGLPGIPLAIALPEVRFELVERTQKKAVFLAECIQTLGLSNVRVIPLDALEYARGAGRGVATVVVSRAAAPVPKLLPAVRRLLKPGGEALIVVARDTVLDAGIGIPWSRLGGARPALVDTGATMVLRLPLQG